MTRYETFVAGVPRPQGSMTLARDPRSGREFAKYSGPTKEWRQKLYVALDSWWCHRPRIEGPVEVRMTFLMPRPKNHFGVKGIKASAPYFHSNAADLDKLCRAVNDALTDAGVWGDDGQVAVLWAAKLYAQQGERTGVHIAIEEAIK